MASNSATALVTQQSVVGFVGVFGNNYQYAESLGESSTTAAAYQQKLRLTTPVIPACDYHVEVVYNYSSDDENAAMDFQLEVDDTTQVFTAQPVQKKKLADGVYNSASAFARVTLTNAAHTIDLDYANTTAKTTYIKNAKIIIWQVA